MKKTCPAFSLFCLLLCCGFFWSFAHSANAQLTADWSSDTAGSETEFRQNLYNNLQRLGISGIESCPVHQIPSLKSDKPTGIFRLSTAEIDEAALVLMDPITELVVFIHQPPDGCANFIVSGRMVEFAQRSVLSPFPNAFFDSIQTGDVVVAIVQDRKTIRPWFRWMEESTLRTSSYLTWMMIATYTGILIIIAISASFLDPIGRRRMAFAYVLYVVSQLVWMIQNFGLGQAWIPIWPSGELFHLMHAFSVAFLVVAIGFAVIEFLEIQGNIRRILVIGVGLAGLAFLSSAWLQFGYRIGSILLALMSVIVIWQLKTKFRNSDTSVKLFAVGIATTMIGGGLQAYSVVAGGEGLSWVAVVAFPLGSFMQALLWFAALHAKIETDRQSLRKKLVFDAEHDDLTKLPNRVFLRRRLEHCIEAAHRDSETVFGLIFLDIDRFKVINDSLGHAVGDRLLQEVSRIITEITRGTGIVARFGGDEFLVLIEKPCTEQSASDLAAKLASTLAKPITIDDLELRVNASAGLVLVTGYYDFVDSVIRDADTALQVAKQEHRGAYVTFDQDMRKKVDHRFNIEQEIQNGLEEDEFSMYFQPIMSIKENRHVGFEALVRWQNAKYGFIRPDEFIPVAEDTGTIRDLGKVILIKSISAVGRWKKQGLWQPGWYVSINVSGEQLYDGSLTQLIEESLYVYNVAPQDIRLELTETSVIANQNAADDVLPHLREQGIKLCMDDFGTGYSSLSYLKVLPFDVIKIDKSFIDEIESEAQSRKLVSTVLTLAADLNFLVVAEGIETEEQQQILAGLNCDYGQGYLYSKPMEENDATEWLRKSNNEP